MREHPCLSFCEPTGLMVTRAIPQAIYGTVAPQSYLHNAENLVDIEVQSYFVDIGRQLLQGHRTRYHRRRRNMCLTHLQTAASV